MLNTVMQQWQSKEVAGVVFEQSVGGDHAKLNIGHHRPCKDVFRFLRLWKVSTSNAWFMISSGISANSLAPKAPGKRYFMLPGTIYLVVDWVLHEACSV